MTHFNAIIELIKSRGHRLTRARKAMASVFLKSRKPLSAPDLMLRLEKMDVIINKTTVYREIDFFKSQKVIHELDIGDGRRRYELWQDNHHHHLICVSCDSIECFELEDCLEAEEKKILRDNNFKTLSHSLKFMGLCTKCQ